MKRTKEIIIGLFIVFLMITLLAGTEASIVGTDCYVSINGNDNNLGTDTQPWRTIQKAADTAIAGDTVYVKNGIYNEQVWVRNSGSLDKWITFTAYPSHTPTIDGTGISMTINANGDRWFGLFNILGKSYINVSGLRITNADYAGFFVTKDYGTEVPSSNIIFKNNYLEKTGAAAIIMLGESTTPATNYIVDGNTLVQSHFRNEPFAMEGISLGHNLDGFEIKNNYIKDSLGVGQIDAKAGITNGKIYCNTCVNSTYACVYIDGFDGGASNIDVFENVVHDMVSDNEYDIVSGFCVASEEGGVVENIRFYNNLAYNNPGTGMLIPWYSKGTVKNIEITSNTFYNNGIGHKHKGGIALDYDKATGVIVRNNIVSQNNEFQISSKVPGAIIDHNLIDGYRHYLHETYGNDYIEGNPLFVNPTYGDFHLQSKSPAIDSGSPCEVSVDFEGNSRPCGIGYDIGAYEYQFDLNHPLNVDMNGDGQINLRDVQYLARHYFFLQYGGFPEYETLYGDGDLDQNGEIGIDDVQLLADKLL